MSMPAWWPHVSCVYCGARTDGEPTIKAWRFSRDDLACYRHVALTTIDPSYQHVDKSGDDVDNFAGYDPPMDAAEQREAVQPSRERVA